MLCGKTPGTDDFTGSLTDMTDTSVFLESAYSTSSQCIMSLYNMDPVSKITLTLRGVKHLIDNDFVTAFNTSPKSPNFPDDCGFFRQTGGHFDPLPRVPHIFQVNHNCKVLLLVENCA